MGGWEDERIRYCQGLEVECGISKQGIAGMFLSIEGERRMKNVTV